MFSYDFMSIIGLKAQSSINNMENNIDMQRELITVAVEHALLEIGNLELETVQARLKNDYKCEIGDCLEHPEYLKNILCDLFGNCYGDILDTINRVVENGNIVGRVEKFLVVLKS